MTKTQVLEIISLLEKKIKIYKKTTDTGFRNYLMGQIDGIILIVSKFADLECSLLLLDLEKDLRPEADNGHREERWE